MKSFELSRATEVVADTAYKDEGINSAMLLFHLRWFTKVRWMIVAVFALVGLVGGLCPELISRVGLRPPTAWPWYFVLGLICLNSGFCFLTRALHERSPNRHIAANLWLQISVDLVALTCLVHIVGGTDTFVPFAYLFHITLACIFFNRGSSFLVVLMAAALYMLSVGLDVLGIVKGSTILIESHKCMQPIGLKLIAALSAVFVWVVVWYLASTLSKSVRKREEDLSRANMKLIRADEEMNKQVLRTTHELKAPFSGMESNIQLLKAKFWAEVPDEVREIIDRIEFRAQILSRRIKEILELGDLKSTDVTRGSLESVDLKMVIDDSIEEVRERAKGRHITIDNAVSSLGVMGREKQLAMLFGNLISNAVSYSHDGENVEVRAREDGNKVFVSVEDHGIGIKPEAVDFVFDEYYRTKEAAQFNRMSTGLGLAIVKEVALELGLGVKVESELDKGTTFEVCLIKG